MRPNFGGGSKQANENRIVHLEHQLGEAHDRIRFLEETIARAEEAMREARDSIALLDSARERALTLVGRAQSQLVISDGSPATQEARQQLLQAHDVLSQTAERSAKRW